MTFPKMIISVRPIHHALSRGLVLLAGCVAALLTVACGGNRNTPMNLATIYAPEYATGFTINEIDGMNSTVITVSNPWQGADSVTGMLFLARDGEKAPAGFEGQSVEWPAKRIVAMSSTHIAMLDAIGETGRIVGVSGLGFISNPEIRKRSDATGDVGYDGNVNYETLISLNPDLVLLYGVNGASSMEGKLRELGIPYMYVGDYLEEAPLGKTEWLVALGEIAGKREEAESKFSEIAWAYNSLANQVAGQGLEEPAVMLNTPYGDSWFMPPAKSYMATLIGDAGGRYVYQQNTSDSSVAVDMEEAYSLASDAACWVNVSNAESLEQLKRLYPKFADTRPVVGNRVYANTLRATPGGGNDFFESGIVHPELILQDLVKILHPELAADKEFTYYRQLK